jgi:hypothetical protein
MVRKRKLFVCCTKIRDDYVNRLIDIAALEQLPFEALNALRYNPEFLEKDLKATSKTKKQPSRPPHFRIQTEPLTKTTKNQSCSALN